MMNKKPATLLLCAFLPLSIFEDWQKTASKLLISSAIGYLIYSKVVQKTEPQEPEGMIRMDSASDYIDGL